MKDHFRLWTSHLLGLFLLLLGVWWLMENISGMPDYKLVVALAAMTGFVLNHFRWHKLVKKLDNFDMYKSINALVVSHYLILLFILAMVDFRK